jgi:phenylpropionate dioxygenase-like ring-hydroxylating dioxygenase large terminal subunit
MLSVEDNEYLCRVGPGTPMGDLFRQYWLPAIRSDEVEPDGRPLRVRLLGEDLIGFRASDGQVGLVQNNCPHRGASLYFGRNEEQGLRCVYHGWKFDVSGKCVDMPNEPAESNFKDKVKAVAYPTSERGGIVWAYMGPREVPPPLPDIEANMLAKGSEEVSVLHRPCNWMQGWEGEMDTVHAAFLHYGAARAEDQAPGSFNFYQYNNRAAKFLTVDTEYGCCNGASRPAGDDTYYWRITQILFPFYNMIPGGPLGESVRIGIYVPVDDYNHLHWEISTPKERLDGTEPADAPPAPRFGGNNRLPNTTDWYGRFRAPENLANDYLIDWDAQKTWKSYTGIASVRIQDCAVTETMGPIYDRSHEHLGTTDTLIIRMRRRMIQAARALREQGITPPGVDDPEVYRQRSGEIILPREANFFDATKEQRTKTYVPREAAKA